MDPELKKQQDILRDQHIKALKAKAEAMEAPPRKSAEYLPPHEQAIVDSMFKAEEKPMWLHPDTKVNPCAEIPLDFKATHIHIKTGGVYRLLFIGIQEATLEKVAIYQNIVGLVWVRPYSEFIDGRFQEIYP